MTKSYKKICRSCGSRKTKKDGKRRGRQSYSCNKCGHVWISGKRIKKATTEKLYREYAIHKQTYQEISERYGISKRTVQRRLDSYRLNRTQKVKPTNVVLLIDTTYMGDYGLMLFKDAYGPKLLHHEYVDYETVDAYKRGVKYLQEEGRKIEAIVCDGRRGLLGGFGDIPTQMCMFHQKQIVRRYITKNPKLEPNKELNEIVYWLCKTEKICFENELQRWYTTYENFIKERRISPTTGKKYYVHRRTRSAYYSLKRNLKYLFIRQDHLHQIDIPNTTNGIEAEFSHLKYKVNLHRGLRWDRKRKVIDYILKSRY